MSSRQRLSQTATNRGFKDFDSGSTSQSKRSFRSVKYVTIFLSSFFTRKRTRFEIPKPRQTQLTPLIQNVFAIQIVTVEPVEEAYTEAIATIETIAFRRDRRCCTRNIATE